MKKYTYTPKPLFYVLIGSLAISAIISPILFGLIGGLWWFFALINFGNRVNKDNDC